MAEPTPERASVGMLHQRLEVTLVEAFDISVMSVFYSIQWQIEIAVPLDELQEDFKRHR